MNEDLLSAFLGNFIAKGNSDEGEGDYKDFLVNYMNAVNQGADEELLAQMAQGIPDDRREQMLNFGGGPSLESNPFIQEGRSGANMALRAVGK